LTSKMEYTDEDLVGIVFMPPKGEAIEIPSEPVEQ
jgi:hypothetical protein